MHTTDTAPRPDAADLHIATRPYPARRAGVRMDTARAGALLEDIRQWWLEVANGWLEVADAATGARDLTGAAEAITDAKAALAIADIYGRATVGGAA